MNVTVNDIGFAAYCTNCGLVVFGQAKPTGHRRLAGCPSCDKQSWMAVEVPEDEIDV